VLHHVPPQQGDQLGIRDGFRGHGDSQRQAIGPDRTPILAGGKGCLS
jgi:hypothetical protein